MEDAQNAMVAVMWIAMYVMATDNAGIVMAMGEPDAPNVVAMEDAGNVEVRVKLLVGIVMERVKQNVRILMVFLFIANASLAMVVVMCLVSTAHLQG
jgi:hypothetical protein